MESRFVLELDSIGIARFVFATQRPIIDQAVQCPAASLERRS